MLYDGIPTKWYPAEPITAVELARRINAKGATITVPAIISIL